MEKVRVLVYMATWAVVAASTNGAPSLQGNDVTSVESISSITAVVEVSYSSKKDHLCTQESNDKRNPTYANDSTFTKRSVKMNKHRDDELMAGNSWPVDSHLFRTFLQDYAIHYNIEKVYFLHVSNGKCIRFIEIMDLSLFAL